MAAAEQLLRVLTLYGFPDAEAVAPALVEACAGDGEARAVVQWLADNLKPEDISGCSKAVREPALTEQEQAVAASFAEALLPAPQLQAPGLDAAGRAARERTARALTEAAEAVQQDAARATELARAETARGDTRVADLRSEVEGQMARVAELLANLERLAGGLLAQLGRGGEPGGLLCMQQLDDFQASDAELMAALQLHYAAEIADEAGESRSKQGPQGPLVSDTGAAAAARAQSLERARLSYGCSLEKHARMVALQAKTEAQLQALQGGFSRRELSSQDAALLRAEADKQQGFLDRLLARKQQLLDVELPALCRSVASMHCWEVVKADYDAELARNRHYAARKQRVAGVLSARAARVAALVAAARQEGGALLRACDTVRAVAEELEGLRAAMELRAELAAAASSAEPAAQPEATPGSCVKAVAAAELTAQRRAYAASLAGGLRGAVPEMQARSGLLHALAFPGAAVAEPELTPKQLTAAMERLREVQQGLLQANDAVYQQQEAYNGVMKAQREQVGLERSVFPLFYTQPERLAAAFRAAQGLPALAPSPAPRGSAGRARGKEAAARRVSGSPTKRAVK